MLSSRISLCIFAGLFFSMVRLLSLLRFMLGGFWKWFFFALIGVEFFDVGFFFLVWFLLFLFRILLGKVGFVLWIGFFGCFWFLFFGEGRFLDAF